MKRSILKTIGVLAIAGVVMWLGEQDYRHELAMEKQYREMVCAGHWPDYWQTNPNCEDKQ
jgi:hypothetical protein